MTAACGGMSEVFNSEMAMGMKEEGGGIGLYRHPAGY